MSPSAVAVLAHGVVGREDLPIPRWLFLYAAVAVLVASFVGLAVLWPQPRLEEARARVVARVPRVFEVLAGLVGIALFAVVVYAGLAGSQSTTANLAPTFIFVLFWVGVPVLSLLFGDVFRAFNPWRALARGVGWVAGRVTRGRGGAMPEPLPYPERLGVWPAVLLILAFAWVELVFEGRDDPSTLAVLALAYAAIQLVGMALYGVEAWTRSADGFSVYFALYAALSPVRWKDRTLGLRRPLSGVTELRAVPGIVALLAVVIGSTSYDGFRESELWSGALRDLQTALVDAGLDAVRAIELAGTLGLVGMVLLIAGLYRLGVAGMRSVDRGAGEGLAGRFAHSLVPIAFAYVLAHYFSLLVYQGQATAYLASNPLGEGADLFGTASATIDYGVVSANAIWYVQVASLLLGHVAGLVLAHDRALLVFKDPKAATRSQYWMLAVMIAFTSLGLWLLSSTSG